MKSRAALLLCIPLVALGCGGDKGAPSPSASPREAPTGPDWSALSPEKVQACLSFPTPLISVDCEFEDDPQFPHSDHCVQFAPASAKQLPLFSILLYAGKSRFANLATRLPSSQPATTFQVAPGRTATIETRGLGLGGGYLWGTVATGRPGFELVLTVEQVAHDYPVSKEQLEALQSVDVGKALRCLDQTLSP